MSAIEALIFAVLFLFGLRFLESALRGGRRY